MDVIAPLLLTLLLGPAPALAGQPDEAASEPLAFDYFTNNWNVIGLKDYRDGSRITPGNEMLLADGKAIQVRLGAEGTPLSRAHGKRAMDGWLPILLVTETDGPIRVTVTYWATPLPDVRDWRAAFAWPTEGENFLCWIQVAATNTSGEPAVAYAEVGPPPAGEWPDNMAAPAAAPSDPPPPRTFRWRWRLAAGETAVGVARYPFAPIADAAAYDSEDAALWLGRTRRFWRDLVLEGTAHIGVPCPKASQALLAAHVCQLIANDHGDVHGGEGFYDTFFIRDGAYQVMELEEAGLHEAARLAVRLYLDRQREDGRFESQTGQLDANGQAMWVLWQYALMTRDHAWLEEVYPRMRRAAEWIREARRSAPADSPYAGLLPAAVADGEFLWDGEHHIVGYDFWNLRGLLCTAEAAQALGRDGEAEELLAEAASYREAIDAAWRRTGLAHFPPSWEGAGTHWGNTETLWPTPIFDRDDERVAALIDHVRDEFGGGYIEGTIQWRGTPQAIHPYMGAYTTMADLALGNDERVVRDFYWTLLHSTEAHAFPEGILYERRTAWSDTIPHVTGACNYAVLLRHMLVHEDGESLVLLSAIPDWWLDEGRTIRVERLPTHFGEMALTVRGTAEGVEVALDPPKRNPPRRIVLRLPASRPLLGEIEGVDVMTRPEQSQRWDFPAVVALYEASDPPPTHQPIDAPSLTTGKPATSSSVLSAHPVHVANDGRRGSTESYWATNATEEDPEPWWLVDLLAPTQLGRVVVVGFYGDERHYGFTVETSVDGARWEMVADERGNTRPSTPDGYTCRFAPRPARFIRVTQTHNSANIGRHLVEVMAYPE